MFLLKQIYISLFLVFFLFIEQYYSLDTLLSSPLELIWTQDSNGSFHANLSFSPYLWTDVKNNNWNFSTRAFGSIPGPTIRVQRCKQYILHFTNELGPNTVFKNKIQGKPFTPNSTNIHVHGLSISPEFPSDYTLTSIEPGTSHDFIYNIPCDHMGGTHWYHSHYHGSTALQVGGGAAGLLIVEDNIQDQIDPILGFPEQLFIIQRIDISALSRWSYDAGDQLFQSHSELNEFYLINGNFQPIGQLLSGKWYRFRILHADPIKNNNVTFIPTNNAGTCSLQLLAKDGVYLSTLPREVIGLDLTTASRADVAIRCIETETVKVQVGGISVATFTILPRNEIDSVISSFSPCRPWYLQDLRNPALTYRNESIHSTSSIYMGMKTVGGYSYNPLEIAFSMRTNTIQEWILINSDAHPFHLHTFHFQLIENITNNISIPNYHQPGDWVDTISGTLPLTIRFKTVRYSGPIIAHCHVLEHEDHGAMIINYVYGGEGYNSSISIGNFCVSNNTTPIPLPSLSCYCDLDCIQIKDCCPECKPSTPVCPNTYFNWSDINTHNNITDLFMVIDEKVYNFTDFLQIHPGGWQPYITHAGHDASHYFHSFPVHTHINIMDRVPCLGYVTGKEPNLYSVEDKISSEHVKSPLSNVAGYISKNGQEYDYIIIGAGSSGSVLAYELSRNPDNSILLIEEGNWAEYKTAGPIGVWDASMWFPTVSNPEIARPYNSTPSIGFNNRTIWAPRAKVVGGCSAHNAHVLIHGNHNDIISWGKTAPQWGWNYLAPYGRVFHELYGTAVINNELPHYPYLDDLFTFCQEAGYHINDHPNPLQQKGCNLRRHIDNKIWEENNDWWLKRKTAFSTFIEPILGIRNNLEILINTRVEKILFNGLDAIGVQSINVWTLKKQNFYARKEVILSAGVFNSPQLLMLSGIGPKEHLKEFNIPIVVDLPGVGGNLRDDGWCQLIGPKLSNQIPSGNPQIFSKWATAGLQMWHPDDGDHMNPPDFNINFYITKNGDDYTIIFEMEPLAQKSLGTVRLQSTDPAAPPIIDPHYNTNPEDLEKWRNIMMEAYRISQIPSLKNITTGGWNNPTDDIFISNETMNQWIANNCLGTNGHPQGTNPMGAASNPITVVDSCLAVHGTRHLRVVDASIFPNPVHGNTNQPAVLVGLRGATLISQGDQCYKFPYGEDDSNIISSSNKSDGMIIGMWVIVSVAALIPFLVIFVKQFSHPIVSS